MCGVLYVCVFFEKQSTSFYVSHFVNEETKNCRGNGTPTNLHFEVCILLN